MCLKQPPAKLSLAANWATALNSERRRLYILTQPALRGGAHSLALQTRSPALLEETSGFRGDESARQRSAGGGW